MSCCDQGGGVHHGVGEQFVESHSGEGFYTYEEGLTCTDKCRGVHDAAVAEMVGATSCHQTGDICHGGHYGLGFANFRNPTGDTVTFRLHACNAGKHRIAITYALANDDPPRPLDVQVNGVDAVGTTGGIATAGTSYQSGARGVNFPATGSWTVWGKVFVEGMFLDGENTVILRAVSNSGPNVDSIEVYPHDDSEIGSAFVDVDNEYNLYIDGHLIGSGSQWDSTDAYNFQASCDVPTVYAIHGIDYEHTAGVAGAGMVAEFNHCESSDAFSICGAVRLANPKRITIAGRGDPHQHALEVHRERSAERRAAAAAVDAADLRRQRLAGRHLVRPERRREQLLVHAHGTPRRRDRAGCAVDLDVGRDRCVVVSDPRLRARRRVLPLRLQARGDQLQGRGDPVPVGLWNLGLRA